MTFNVRKKIWKKRLENWEGVEEKKQHWFMLFLFLPLFFLIASELIEEQRPKLGIHQEGPRVPKTIVIENHSVVRQEPEQKPNREAQVTEITGEGVGTEGETVLHTGGAESDIPDLTPSALQSLIRKHFPEDPETAIAIAKAESGLNPEAKGDTHIEFIKDGIRMGHSCGIFQVRVLPGRPTCEELKDPAFNIQYARNLYEKSGWKPWSAYTNGKYLSYLK